ncbi:MAG: hypothetical protein R6U54_02875 [Candidatus Omnitrophota bacterium]
MISRRKIIYILVFLIFILGVLVRIKTVTTERQLETKTVAGQWQKKGKPVVAKKISKENIDIFSKITIVSDDTNSGYAYLPKVVQKKIQSGQSVFKADKDNNSIGEVIKVAKEINLDVGMYLVKVKLNQNIFKDKPKAVVYINTEVLEDAICLPREAVRSADNQSFVWTVKGNKARKRLVKVARHDGYGVIIQSGLSQGDLVVLEGYTILSEGDKVNIIKSFPERKND